MAVGGYFAGFCSSRGLSFLHVESGSFYNCLHFDEACVRDLRGLERQKLPPYSPSTSTQNLNAMVSRGEVLSRLVRGRPGV